MNKRILISICLACLIQAIYPAFFVMPQIAKLVFGLTNLLIIFFIFQCHKIRDLYSPKSVTYKLFICYLIYCVYLLISALYHSSEYINSILFSPFNFFVCLLPCFSLLASNMGLMGMKRIKLLTIFCLVSYLICTANVGLASFCLCLFYPFVSKKSLYFLLLLAFFVWDNITGLGLSGDEGGSRAFVLESAVALSIIIAGWIIKKRKLSLIVVLIYLALPLLFILFLVRDGVSLFEMVQANFSSRVGDSVDTTDTRTFLFMDMLSNITNISDFFFGKGLAGGYETDFSDSVYATNVRLAIEVTWLHYFLKGGFVLVFLLYAFITSAVVSAFKHSKNNFIIVASMMASGFVFLMIVADYPSRNIVVKLILWLCVGMCHSRTWLSKTDDDINKIFKKVFK